MIFRLSVLVLVVFLGSVAYNSRLRLEPKALLRLAAQQSLLLTVWVIAGVAAISIIEILWINNS